ncbi:hypothetical protein Btru_061081 [Bulinus truncatus]|nr:hypothetical protein Btru_061081 [Bulinus truncatus]
MATHVKQINGFKKSKKRSGKKSCKINGGGLLASGHKSSRGKGNVKIFSNGRGDLETDSATSSHFRELENDTAVCSCYLYGETFASTRQVYDHVETDRHDSGICIDFIDQETETSSRHVSRERDTLRADCEQGHNKCAPSEHAGIVKGKSNEDNNTTVVYSIIPRDTPGVKNNAWEHHHLNPRPELEGSVIPVNDHENEKNLSIDAQLELIDAQIDGDSDPELRNAESDMESSETGKSNIATIQESGNCSEKIRCCKSILHCVDVIIEVDDQSSESVRCDVGHQQTTGRCHQEERHSEYHPVSQLTPNMLPADIRDELLFLLLQLLSALTVKITVKQISGRRSISQKFRPPLQGTGWLFDRPPEIDTIERSLRGIVYIETSSQLVMDSSEARSCIVEFSTEAAKFFRKVHLQCESVQHISSSGEVKTYLKCTTEDTDFVFKLNMLQEQIRSLSDSLPLYVKDRLTNMAIVLGYFHGELAMSFSNSSIIRRKLVKEVIEGRERHQLKNIITCPKDEDYDTVQLLLFTAVTCPGCLGAPIITFKQFAQGSAQYSLNIWTHCGVLESFEFSCSSIKAYTPEKLVTCLEQRSITSPQTQEKKTLDTQNDIWTEAQKSQSNQEHDAHTIQHQCAQSTGHQCTHSTGHQCTQSTQQEGIQTSQQQLNHEPRAETSPQQGTDPAPQTQQITPENFCPNSTNTQNEITAVTEAPSYPAYLTFSKRLESFSNWPATNNIFQPIDLAKNGFFYAGYSDCVRCYQCGLGLKSWKPGDDIVTEHKRFRPNCPFLRLLTTGPGASFPGSK